MRRSLGSVALILMLAAAVPLTVLGDDVRYAVADTEDLLSFPQAALDSQQQMEQQVFAIVIPGTHRVLIMRPITESEYGSFQVQAIAYQMIEQEMLAAAIVMPVVTPSDVAAFSQELLRFLQQQVNEISGFSVFNTIPPDAN